MKHQLNCILVIDDDEPTNFFTRIILEEAECTRHIKIMQSAQEALDYLFGAAGSDDANNPFPDLILLDINMPAMNGWEFLEEYKMRNQECSARIVMLTTSLFPKDMEKAKEIPEISGFENKPISIAKIEAILEKYFVDTAVSINSLPGDQPQNEQAVA
jgi:CheY-like chemotaxis protein